MFMALLTFIACAIQGSGFPRIIALFMMGVGILLEFNKGSGIEGISQGILLILPLICLITLTPLLSLPLKLGGYMEAVGALLRNLLYQPRKLFAGITTSLFILSPVLSLGTVRIIDEFLTDLKLPSIIYAKSYLVGFTTAIMWSPYFASVSLVLYYLNMPVGNYILFGIGISIIALIVGNILFVVWERNHPLWENTGEKLSLKRHHRNQLMKLAIFVILVMFISLTIEYITKWSMVVIVCLISIAIPLASGAITKNRKSLQSEIKVYRDKTIIMMNNEIMLFTSAGLFAHAIQGTNFANIISNFLSSLASKSFLLFAIALLALVLVVTFIGLHQIAVIAALAMQLNAHELGISTLSLAILLLIAWAISSAISPFSGLNMTVSRLVGISGVHVGLRANGLHLSILAVLGVSIIMWIR
ncbi:TRAP transporter large permease subunit [Alkalihalobacillus sp. AL-G]|uniref:TRAP transporter large permease subunit n=1 Tax=Alkalihalobacillus sp. AL-G TaxID=2926399 RepID=UPI00272AB547|nr:TRAP transporter large permease subunit [Alkalihalobacillus sp. AL-G]WLD93718.1 TRAP transporter large permease subunit [Alkalihalobacillus sp. AL-G]